MPTLAITGANRGIGLALTKRFLEAGWSVHATAREPDRAEALSSLPGVTLYQLDVASQDSIEAFAQALKGVPIDALINNAGSMGPRYPTFGESQLADWVEILTINTASPWLVTERLAPNLEAGEGKRVAIVSSQLGSLKNATDGWPPIYATSKAGTNMVMRQLALALGEKGIVTFTLHPGWVRTDMGGTDADISPEESAAAIFRLVTGATQDMNGRFFNYDGTPMPW